MGKGIASQYCQPKITICEECSHRDVCGDREYLTENKCCDFWGWVSVNERLPDAKGHYLAIGKLNYAHGGTNESNDGDVRRNMVIAYFDSTGLFNHPDISYWRHLPEPPKEETDGQ